MCVGQGEVAETDNQIAEEEEEGARAIGTLCRCRTAAGKSSQPRPSAAPGRPLSSLHKSM